MLVRAAAILNAIYDPVDPRNQGRTSNQMIGSPLVSGWDIPVVTYVGCRSSELARAPGHPKKHSQSLFLRAFGLAEEYIGVTQDFIRVTQNRSSR